MLPPQRPQHPRGLLGLAAASGGGLRLAGAARELAVFKQHHHGKGGRYGQDSYGSFGNTPVRARWSLRPALSPPKLPPPPPRSRLPPPPDTPCV